MFVGNDQDKDDFIDEKNVEIEVNRAQSALELALEAPYKYLLRKAYAEERSWVVESAAVGPDCVVLETNNIVIGVSRNRKAFEQNTAALDKPSLM